jgi:hypothetical protein
VHAPSSVGEGELLRVNQGFERGLFRGREREVPFGKEFGFNVGEGAIVRRGCVEELVQDVVEDEGYVCFLYSVDEWSTISA